MKCFGHKPRGYACFSAGCLLLPLRTWALFCRGFIPSGSRSRRSETAWSKHSCGEPQADSDIHSSGSEWTLVATWRLERQKWKRPTLTLTSTCQGRGLGA